MKKLLLILFMAGFMSANAIAIAGGGCHAQACAAVEDWENAYPDATLGELEALYYSEFEQCNMQ